MFTDSAAGNTKASSTAYDPCIVSAVTCRLGPVEHDLPAESCSGTMLNSEACRKQQKHIAGGLGCSVAGQGYSKTVVRTRSAVAQEVLVTDLLAKRKLARCKVYSLSFHERDASPCVCE